MKTDQEKFWKEDFGTEYTDRNNEDLSHNIQIFSKILGRTSKINSVYEVGTNRGKNLNALKAIDKNIITNGIEINEYAAKVANSSGHNVECGSILEKDSHEKFDLVFTRGVLIHINPDYLNVVYDFLVNTSNKYILIDEYFSPMPVEIDYRGNKGKLFKRDFAKEIMGRHSLSLVDYGFSWRFDPSYPGDDTNWFLFEKNSA
jgi:spore coat polysaccharide biosynthesis protein SpsF